MIKKVEEQFENEHSSFPYSRKIYVQGTSSTIRVPMREIPLSPSKKLGGEEEFNDPVRVYDTSGAWGDESFHKDPHKGLPEVRLNWITEAMVTLKK